jgi:hypothetical protein
MRAFLVTLGVWVGLSAAALAAPITYQTTLSGPNEFPANSSTGTGTAIVIHDATAHTLSVTVSFSGLSVGNTASHIHCCVSPSAANPIAGVATPTPTFPGFPSGTTSGSYQQTFDLTLASSWNAAFITANGGTPASAEAALASGLDAGFAYLNIHSSNFTGGEIRGFLVPEPALAALLSVGGLVLAARRPRR